MNYDVIVTTHGGEMQFDVCTALARDWVDSYVDACKWMGNNIFVVDPAVGEALCEAMRQYGLDVRGSPYAFSLVR